MRPITGSGSARSAAVSASSARPAPLRLRGAIASAGARQPVDRQRAAADLALAAVDADLEARRQALPAAAARCAAASASSLGARPGEQAQRGQALRQPLGIAGRAAASASSAASVQLVMRSARFSGTCGCWSIRSRCRRSDAGLRAAEQLVAAEGDDVGAVAPGLSCGSRLVRQAPAREVDQRAAAQVARPAAGRARGPAGPARLRRPRR